VSAPFFLCAGVRGASHAVVAEVILRAVHAGTCVGNTAIGRTADAIVTINRRPSATRTVLASSLAGARLPIITVKLYAKFIISKVFTTLVTTIISQARIPIITYGIIENNALSGRCARSHTANFVRPFYSRTNLAIAAAHTAGLVTAVMIVGHDAACSLPTRRVSARKLVLAYAVEREMHAALLGVTTVQSTFDAVVTVCRGIALAFALHTNVIHCANIAVITRLTICGDAVASFPVTEI